jgi:hypothetical protein
MGAFQHTPEGQFDRPLNGVVRRGHGVASGRSTALYPQGTLAPQIPLFKELGVDLSGYFRGTLNIDISPCHFALQAADATLRQVRWTDRIPPEDFSFVACLVEFAQARHRALVYWPHPETKVEHFQDDSVLEVMAPRIPGIAESAPVTLWLRARQIRVW